MDITNADDFEQEDEKLNDQAIKIINRIRDKLAGDDYGTAVSLSIEAQVNQLVKDATKTENLAQMYSGWHSSW